MFLIGLLALAAQTTVTGNHPSTQRSDAAFGVTATVVRPVQISMPKMTAEGPVIVLNNASAIDVRLTGARLTQPDEETIVIKGDGSPSIGLTIIY